MLRHTFCSRPAMVGALARDRIRQRREAAHRHPHREVLTLDVAGRNVLRVRIAARRGSSDFVAPITSLLQPRQGHPRGLPKNTRNSRPTECS